MKKWKKRTAVLAVFLLCMGCGHVQGKEPGGGSGPAYAAEQAVEAGTEERAEEDAAQAAVPAQEGALNKEMTELEKEEVLEFMSEKTGVDFAPYAADAEGVTYSGLYYVRVRILSGGEEKAGELLRDFCGEALDPEDLLLPKAPNRICDDLGRTPPYTAFKLVRQGQNGAKTDTTSFYLAESGGVTSLFVIGHR